MRVSPALLLALLVAGCSLDWNRYDPRLGQGGASAGGSTTTTTSGGGDGGTGGGSPCGVDETLCDEACVDAMSDPEHCGSCTTQCAAADVCISGNCPAAPSCRVLHQARPALADGVYPLAPGGGVTPFDAHCDMTTEGGGWTLVASVVDNSYFNGTVCHTLCDPDPATTCDETPFTANDVAGDVTTFLQADHKSAAYAAVAFDEMLFADSNAQYVSYDVSGPSVLAWYPAGLQNYVAGGVEEHPSFSYPAKATNIDPTLNACGTLRVSFNVEDSDSLITSTCHTSHKGPAWSNVNNSQCYWDEAGIRWSNSAFFLGNSTTYRLWLVR